MQINEMISTYFLLFKYYYLVNRGGAFRWQVTYNMKCINLHHKSYPLFTFDPPAILLVGI